MIKTYVICRSCGKTIIGRAPKGGDDSVAVPHRHKKPDGSKCDGHLYIDHEEVRS